MNIMEYTLNTTFLILDNTYLSRKNRFYGYNCYRSNIFNESKYLMCFLKRSECRISVFNALRTLAIGCKPSNYWRRRSKNNT